MACWKLFFVSFALLAALVGAKLQRIFYGEDAKIEEFPYQVSIRLFNRHHCGGAIISQRHILTAAHCFDQKMDSLQSFGVVTGTSSRKQEGSFHQIANITVHPDYSGDDNRAMHDIAVITLKHNVVFDKYQQKINLPEHNFKVGSRANFTGWGLTNQFPPVRPKRLQTVEVVLLSTEECQKLVINPEETKINETEICSIRNNTSITCFGDSGGPLVVSGELVGIGSWSDGQICAHTHPDVYTNIYHYKSFIQSIINQKI